MQRPALSVPPHSRPSVCVIGAGLAGLVTAKVLQQDGFEVTVFEKMPAIGGVWIESRTYPGLRTNNPRETYAFSDFPYPASADEFPTAEQVRRYLRAYAEHFGVLPRVRLSTEVLSVARAQEQPGAGTTFQVTVAPADGTARPERHSFDFVAVCNGVFSAPSVPLLDGQARFAGLVLHSSHVSAPGLLRGKRVVVVGAGKSALDCAMAGAAHGSSCTMVLRRAHWMVPRYVLGLRLDRLFATRFAELLLPPYHTPSTIERSLHRAAAPLIKAWWRLQSWLVSRVCGTPEELKPATPLPSGLENSGVGAECYRAVKQGRVRVVRGRPVSFTKASLELDTGEQIYADVVIFATGWRQDLSFLHPDLRRAVAKEGRFQLYRHVLPPTEPRLGFVGYASSSACPLTSEIAAHWLSHGFQGHLALPSVREMEDEIVRVHEWTARMFPGHPEGFFIGPYVSHYVDDLVRDMGVRTRRTRHLVSEYFAPFWPERYRGLAEERRGRLSRRHDWLNDVERRSATRDPRGGAGITLQT